MSSWVITISGDRPIAEVADELARCGFELEQVLTEIGVITGRGSDDIVARARKVAGVADVSATVNVDIGPPGSPETW